MLNSIEKKPVEIKDKDSFSVLLLGVDTDRGKTRSDSGRTNTMIMTTVSPSKHTMTMVSIPRDTYTDIVGHCKKDKINHAYAFGGVSMSINTVQNLLQAPVDYYVKIDMIGLQNIVGAVGGVDVNNNLAFDSGKNHFPIGQVHLTEGNVMSYVRMRYDDPDGDYGRQRRQQQVVGAILQKFKEPKVLTNYQEILQVLESNVETNLTTPEMINLVTKYRGDINRVDNFQMRGTGMMLNGVSYQQMSDKEINKYRDIIAEQLGLNP